MTANCKNCNTGNDFSNIHRQTVQTKNAVVLLQSQHQNSHSLRAKRNKSPFTFSSHCRWSCDHKKNRPKVSPKHQHNVYKLQESLLYKHSAVLYQNCLEKGQKKETKVPLPLRHFIAGDVTKKKKRPKAVLNHEQNDVYKEQRSSSYFTTALLSHQLRQKGPEKTQKNRLGPPVTFWLNL